jgi:hypothetical protein
MCQALSEGKEEPEKRREHGGSIQKLVPKERFYLSSVQVRAKIKVVFLVGKSATQAENGKNKQPQT